MELRNSKRKTGSWTSGIASLVRMEKSDSNLAIENSYYWKETSNVAVYNEEDSNYGVTKVDEKYLK